MLRKAVCMKIRYLFNPVFSSPPTRYKPAEGNGEGESYRTQSVLRKENTTKREDKCALMCEHSEREGQPEGHVCARLRHAHTGQE